MPTTCEMRRERPQSKDRMLRSPISALQAVVQNIAKGDGRTIWNRFNPSARGMPELASRTEGAAVRRVRDLTLLVQRYGRAAVLEFCVETLWPALLAFRENAVTGKAAVELAVWAIQTSEACSAPDDVLAWCARLEAALPQLLLDEARERDLTARREARSAMAVALRRCAGQCTDPIPVYELIATMGELTPADETRHATLLLARRETNEAALVVYLRLLDRNGATPVPDGLLPLVLGQLSIDEETPQESLPQRLLLNHRLLLSRGHEGEAARHIGLGYLRQNDPLEALVFLKLAQARRDEGGLSSFYLAQALFQTDQFDEASEMFRRAVERGCGHTRVVGWQALARAKAGRYDEAFEQFRQAELSLGSENITPEFFVYWGRASFLAGAIQESETRFRRAMELDRGGMELRAINGAAICAERLGRRAEGIALLEKHLRGAAPGSSAASAYLLGRLLQAQGQLAEAVMYYRVATHANGADPAYKLALGLALDDLGDAKAIDVLEDVASSPLKSPEIYRRLAVRHLAANDRKNARFWLAQLWQEEPGRADVQALVERDRVSEALEAFLAGNDRKAVQFFGKLAEPAASEGVRHAHAFALALLAMGRLRAGDARQEFWPAIERAHEIWSCPETRFLLGVSWLMRGDFAAAVGILDALVQDEPSRAECAFFLALSRYFAGAEGAEHELATMSHIHAIPEFVPLVALMQAQMAAVRSDFALAAEKLQEWAQDPAAANRLALSQELVNEFTAVCLRLGVSRLAQVPRIIAKLSETFPQGYWELASVLVKHQDLAARGPAHANLEKVQACDQAYRDLVQKLPAHDPGPAVNHYARWLQFLAVAHLERREAAAALDALTVLDRLPVDKPAATDALRKLVDARLKQASHEAAFACLYRDPDRARAIWEELQSADPSDLQALHHLACFHWSRAYDLVAAGKVRESLTDWTRGLNYYRQLYEHDEYWNAMREKGRRIVQPGLRFDEEQFESWRRDALRQLALVLLDLIAHVMIEHKGDGVKIAAGVMGVLHGSSIPDPLKAALSEELASRRLEDDPTRLSDYPGAKARALETIDIDSANVRARRFLLRAVTFQVNTAVKEGNQAFETQIGELMAIERHASWLEQKIDSVGDRSATISDLTAYYDELAQLHHSAGQKNVVPANQTLDRIHQSRDPGERGRLLSQLEAYLTHCRDAFRASDRFSRKSLDLQPVNLTADRRLQDHQSQYSNIDNLLGQIRGAR